MAVQDVTRGAKINAQVDPGQGQTVQSYSWKLDGTVLNNPSYTFDTSLLSLGLHTILFQATNSCGNSGDTQLQFNLIGGITIDQTDPININQVPTMAYTITLRRKTDLTITVKDDPNGTNPNAPVVGATVSINTTPTATTGTTNATGMVTFAGIKLGSYTVTTTFT